jgi:PAS domain S-box-containing protein
VASHGLRDGWEPAFRLTFECSSNGMALVDGQREFVDINDALLSLLGARREQIVGTSVVAAIPSEELAFAQQEWDAFLRSGDYSGGGPIIRGDGQTVEIEVAARLMTLGGRRLAICVVTSASLPGPPVTSGPDEILTEREREVVSQIALGHESPRIARELQISQETVRTHVRNAMGKLGAHTRAQLVASVLSRDDALRHPRFADSPRPPEVPVPPSPS